MFTKINLNFNETLTDKIIIFIRIERVYHTLKISIIFDAKKMISIKRVSTAKVRITTEKSLIK